MAQLFRLVKYYNLPRYNGYIGSKKGRPNAIGRNDHPPMNFGKLASGTLW